MSSDATPAPSDSPSSEQTQPAKRSRSPVERVVVWGGILALLTVCGVEAMARFGYERSLSSLETAIQNKDGGEALTIEGIDSHLSGFPSREDDQKSNVITYRWSGLLKNYGSIHLPYSGDNVVVSIEVSDTASFSFEEEE